MNGGCRDGTAASCKSFLDANTKARAQMRLERRLREFENSELR